MQTENVKSLRTLGCAWKFSKKGTYCVILFAFSLCLDEHANIFMYEYCKNQIAHITLFKTENWIRDLKIKIENSECKMIRR